MLLLIKYPDILCNKTSDTLECEIQNHITLNVSMYRIFQTIKRSIKN